jgi:NTE family protein
VKTSLLRFFGSVLAWSLIFSINIKAQANSTPVKQLKVGLVLSGGGARGVAHVGVLKWFEEHRIPVDYLVGTSMGGLIGAIYAMGMSPDEMNELLHSIKWNEILSSGPSYKQLSLRRKEDQRFFQTGIELGLRQGISLPAGVSTDHYIGLLFDRLTLPYSGIANFDELPIPYRCVATDFLRAQQVVLKDGPLSLAMRAAMSIPGVFNPVMREERVLVDGGLLNNIPTDVMRELNPDVVIAVDVGTALGDLQSISSLPGILSQSVGVMMIERDRRNLRLADLIIAPDLGNHSILDFSTIDDLIEIGYRAAEQKSAVLKKFALENSEWEDYLRQRSAKKRHAVPLPNELEISGISLNAGNRLRAQLLRDTGLPLEVKQLEAALTRVTGQGRYRSLGYTVAPGWNNPDRKVILVHVNEKQHAPPTLNFGFELDGSDVDEINFTIGGRLTLYDIWREGTEWRTDMKLGFGNIFASEYFIPIGREGFFTAPFVGYKRERRDLFSGDARVAEYQLEKSGGGIDFGYLWRYSEFRIGFEAGRIAANVRAGDPMTLPTADGTTSLFRARWTYDGQDSATIPRSGFRLSGEGRWYFKSPNTPNNFAQAEVKLSAFHPVSNRGSLFLVGSGGTSFAERDVGTQQYILGGPFRLGAYNRDEFRGNQYALLSTGYLHQVYQLSPIIGGKIYAGGWVDFGGAFGGNFANNDGNRYRTAISAGVVMDTILGPFSLIGSYGEGGRGKIYFAIGKFF